jgi:acetyl esterase/lipase
MSRPCTRSWTIALWLIISTLACELAPESHAPPPSGAASARAEAPARPRYTVEVEADMPYGPTTDVPRRRLDLYRPRGPELSPCLLWIHGGAWIGGDKRGAARLAGALASGGVAVAAMNYRLSGRGGPRHPAHVEDAAAAFVTLRKNARRWRLDPARLSVGGHSAGAHMSALLALDPRYLGAAGARVENIAGIVGLEGIYDVPALIERWPDYRSMFIEAAFGRRTEAWRGASPVSWPARVGPAWWIGHSPSDELVDLRQSRRFVEHLERGRATVSTNLRLEGRHFAVVESIGVARGAALTKELRRFVEGARASSP